MVRQYTVGEPYVKVGLNGNHRVDFLNPKREQIRIEDIANGLAKTCRFQGALAGWYSTAEHSILGADKASTEQGIMEFLIHDAAEYVFSDVAAPIKAYLPDYKKQEEKFQRFINLCFLGYEELGPEVKEIDRCMCATEMVYLRDSDEEDLTALPYVDVVFRKWNPQQAFNAYLKALVALFPKGAYA